MAVALAAPLNVTVAPAPVAVTEPEMLKVDTVPAALKLAPETDTVWKA